MGRNRFLYVSIEFCGWRLEKPYRNILNSTVVGQRVYFIRFNRVLALELPKILSKQVEIRHLNIHYLFSIRFNTLLEMGGGKALAKQTKITNVAADIYIQFVSIVFRRCSS